MPTCSKTIKLHFACTQNAAAAADSDCVGLENHWKILQVEMSCTHTETHTLQASQAHMCFCGFVWIIHDDCHCCHTRTPSPVCVFYDMVVMIMKFQTGFIRRNHWLACILGFIFGFMIWPQSTCEHHIKIWRDQARGNETGRVNENRSMAQ